MKDTDRARSSEEAHKGIAILESIPLRYHEPDLAHALTLARQNNMYAYDAYFLDCATRHNAPLLTLDRALRTAARHLNVATWEV